MLSDVLEPHPFDVVASGAGPNFQDCGNLVDAEEFVRVGGAHLFTLHVTDVSTPHTRQ
jgi:hypothetical protein